MSRPPPSSSPSPAAGGEASLMEKELEVAGILLELPKLVLEVHRCPRRLPEFLRWGARRRRSVPDEYAPAPAPPIPRPPPLPPVDEGGHEGGGAKEGGRDATGRGVGGGGCAAAGRETSSPASPLSFLPSGGEEADKARPQPATGCPTVKSFKNAKRHKEWVEQQNRIIASLSDQKANLQRSTAELRGHRQRLKARNSRLRELQAKLREQKIRQRESHHYTAGPAIYQSLAPGPLHGHGPWREGQAGGGAWVPGEGGRAALDLNARPEEGGEELGMGVGDWLEEQRRRQEESLYKAAISAQARKRRLEIQREKNLSSSAAAVVSYKMPRLR